MKRKGQGHVNNGQFCMTGLGKAGWTVDTASERKRKENGFQGLDPGDRKGLAAKHQDRSSIRRSGYLL